MLIVLIDLGEGEGDGNVKSMSGTGCTSKSTSKKPFRGLEASSVDALGIGILIRLSTELSKGGFKGGR